MRINQLYCNFGNHFADAIAIKYKLDNRTHNLRTREPLFMFGCYDYRQLSVALHHANFGNLVVICWAGTDAQILTRVDDPLLRDFWPNQLRNYPNIKHIAISRWIADDLDKLGLQYYRLPVTPHDYSDIKPCAPGDSIYMYKPGSKMYNGGMYDQIKERVPYPFIEADFGTYTRDELMEVYKKCFIGLRFTEHDGLSNTVCEMGMMGRLMITNGDTPNCIWYTPGNVDDIVFKIKQEHDRRFTDNMHDEIAASVREYLNIGDDFLNTEFYG